MCREVNQATWNSFTPSSKSTGWNWNQSDTIYNFNTLNIDKCISSDLCEAYNRTGKFQRCSQRWPFFRLSWDRQKLLVDSTPVEKFVSQVVTWPAATRVFLPTTKGGREETLGTRLAGSFAFEAIVWVAGFHLKFLAFKSCGVWPQPPKSLKSPRNGIRQYRLGLFDWVRGLWLSVLSRRIEVTPSKREESKVFQNVCLD